MCALTANACERVAARHFACTRLASSSSAFNSGVSGSACGQQFLDPLIHGHDPCAHLHAARLVVRLQCGDGVGLLFVLEPLGGADAAEDHRPAMQADADG